MNQYLPNLQPYPFEKLNALKSTVTANSKLKHIALSIGEPKHKAPQFVVDVMSNELGKLENYPTTKGTDQLREAIAQWANNRFKLSIEKESNLHAQGLDANKNILPVNGTREALFAFAQVVVDLKKENPAVLMPNPFYQIYEGAAILAGAKPIFLNCNADNNFLPDLSLIDEQTWKDCQLFYLCTPGNPSGFTYSIEELKQLISLADKHDFIIASDECYSELYRDEDKAPAGILEACHQLGRTKFERCVAFHSLSKRSNLPGLRSGFVAGDEQLISNFLKYRTYHGCAMPIYTQLASIAAWQDEKHVKENRSLYREKYERFSEILGQDLHIVVPPASFYLWIETPISDINFAQQLFEKENITVLPGRFLARNTNKGNPGENRVRIALVAPIEECEEAAKRIKRFIRSL